MLPVAALLAVAQPADQPGAAPAPPPPPAAEQETRFRGLPRLGLDRRLVDQAARPPPI